MNKIPSFYPIKNLLKNYLPYNDSITYDNIFNYILISLKALRIAKDYLSLNLSLK